MRRWAECQISSKGPRWTKTNFLNGARSGSASCDVQCFRQEPQKAILSGAVGHHTLAQSTALKQGWGGMAPLLPIVWMELLLFIYLSKSVIFFCHFPLGGWSRELLTEIWAQLGPWIVHLFPVNSPDPEQSLELVGTKKKGYRFHNQSLIESVHRDQLQKNCVQHVLGLLTQHSMPYYKTFPSIVRHLIFQFLSVALKFTSVRLHKGELFSQTSWMHAKLGHL